MKLKIKLAGKSYNNLLCPPSPHPKKKHPKKPGEYDGLNDKTKACKRTNMKHCILEEIHFPYLPLKLAKLS